MTLRRISMYLQLGSVFAILTALIALGGVIELTFWWFLIAVLLVIGAFRAVPRVVARRGMRRFEKATTERDFPVARQLLLELHELYRRSPQGLALVRFQAATLAGIEGEHARAAEGVASIDASVLGATWAPILHNNTAWYRVMAGDAVGALEAARASMAATESATCAPAELVGGADLPFYQAGTMGAALVLSGECEAAVPFLERALTHRAPDAYQAARELFLGDAFRGLGQIDASRAAYGRAIALDASGTFGERARERLKDSAYRG